jgi:hemerythrin-like domain-containing protein
MAARKKSAARKQPSSTKKSATKKSASSKKKSSGKRSAPADAIALLRADHKAVKDLFEQFEKTRKDERKEALAEQICKELSVHAQIEEEIFYPATREVIRQEDLVDEATVEHQSAKDLIAQIREGSASDDLWEAKVKVLGEYIDHHVKEEQNEMFPMVKKTKLDLKALGEQLMARKMELMGEADEGNGNGGGGKRGRGSKGGGGKGGGAAGGKNGSGGAGGKGGGSGEEDGGGEGEGIVARMARGMGLAGGT